MAVSPVAAHAHAGDEEDIWEEPEEALNRSCPEDTFRAIFGQASPMGGPKMGTPLFGGQVMRMSPELRGRRANAVQAW